jgi:putative acetyltransferase
VTGRSNNTGVMLQRVTTPADLATARGLFAEYGASIAHLAGASLNAQRFDEELVTLPGRYAEPRGRIYLALADGAGVGCAALRPIDTLPGDAGPVGELKRMYVRPTWRGRGLGRLLIDRIIADAREAGYGTLKLDTDPRLEAANALYQSLGFGPTPKFNNDPDPTTLYFALPLRGPLPAEPAS